MSRTIVNMLRESARKYADRPAYRQGERELSYAQLEQETNRLALRFSEIKRQEAILFCCGDPFDAILGFWACLKIGGICIPLNVEGDETSIKATIEDSGVKNFYVSPDKLAMLRPYIPDGAVMYWRSDSPADKSSADIKELQFIMNGDSCGSGLKSEDVAFVFYTSGSTGTPKGVMITHGSIVTYVEEMARVHALNTDDIFIAQSGLHTDAVLFQLLAPIARGGLSILIPFQHRWSGRYASEIIQREKVSILHYMPSVLEMLFTGGVQEYPSVRVLIVHGEKLSAHNLERALRLFPSAAILSVFGCTEVNDIFFYRIPLLADTTAPIPLGEPFSYAKVLVLNDRLEECEEGVTGELYVHAETQMSGYLGLSASPFVQFQGRLFYPTKDMVKRVKDSYFYVGRRDTMCKINGHRVFTSEVEAALLKHEWIKEAAVIRHPSENYLVAFLFTQRIVNELELRNYCARRVPAFSIPKRFSQQNLALPKTTSGKINYSELRKRLDIGADVENESHH